MKKNLERLSDKFQFQLNDAEKMEPVTNCDLLEILKGIKGLV